MKMCASCGCPEIDHEGLSCRGPGGYGGCGCRGFEDPDEPEAFEARAPVDRELMGGIPPLPQLPVDGDGNHLYTWS